ncbi:MAG: glutamyl-tRNA reductase [Candidatus Margulisbacteria bacterium]|nr:glutamyl-tRNA reductase [Candidatus Margulisiibacteriota bacterium]
MVLAVFSIHYQSADIRLLEKVSANKDDMTFYLNGLLGELFFNEMTIISTCNRTEWVFVTPDPKKAVDMLVRTIKTKTHISCSVLHKIGELHIGPDALTHLFELASGLKSMVLGENEILSQIKFGHSFCMEFGATGALLNKIFQSIIATGKLVRSSTNISKGAHSVSSIAIDAIHQKNPNFLNEPILLIGAGSMVQRALAKLASMGHKYVFVSNRTMSRVEHLAHAFDHVTVMPYASIKKRLHEFSTIYIAISSKSLMINRQDIQHLRQEIVLVDLGIPRNIDPECGRLDHATLISIPELESVSNATLSARADDIPNVRVIIQDAIADIKRWEDYRQQPVKSWKITAQYA